MENMENKAITNEDLVAFMRAMQTANDKLVENLSSEIKQGREDTKKDLEIIKKNIDAVKSNNI